MAFLPPNTVIIQKGNNGIFSRTNMEMSESRVECHSIYRVSGWEHGEYDGSQREQESLAEDKVGPPHPTEWEDTSVCCTDPLPVAITKHDGWNIKK